jgi:hypothetical protein
MQEEFSGKLPLLSIIVTRTTFAIVISSWKTSYWMKMAMLRYIITVWSFIDVAAKDLPETCRRRFLTKKDQINGAFSALPLFEGLEISLI